MVGPASALADRHNAWITVDAEGWRTARAAHGARAAAGELRGPLDGLSLAVKDNLDVAGLPTTHGSAALATASPARTDAEVVARLRAAGMAIVGKTHMTELACGTSGLNTHFGDGHNPHDPKRHPGGSSSGSAIAVAAGHVDVALGSDTGGSIRIPAAACGVVGLKPTFGRVSNDGMGVCARALDTVGPITTTVDLAARALDAMQLDGWPSLRFEDPPVGNLRVGMLVGAFIDRCDPVVQAAFEDTLVAVQALGATVVGVDLGLDLDAVTDTANPLGRDLLDHFGPVLDDDARGTLDPEVAEWLAFYETIDDATYSASLTEQRRLRTLVERAQREVDLLLCPTLRTPPCPIDEATSQPRHLRAGNLELFNLTGQPSLTIPHGTADGLPLGVLVTGRPGEDHLVLALGAALHHTG